MLGVIVTLLFCAGIAGLAHRALAKPLQSVDPAAGWGLSGLFGLGLTGTLILLLGLMPSGISLATIAAAVLALAGYALGKPWTVKAEKPTDKDWAFIGAIALAFLMALIGTLSHPDLNEWDSLAYHLAVPKIWLQQDRIVPVPGIHHSNFPFAVDNLFILGLKWGGFQGAKAFVLAMAAFGAAAIFGLTRQVYGKTAGWWAALAFMTAPVVLWLTGTAYIDVPNGLYAGLVIALAALWISNTEDKGPLLLAAISLGLAMGSKYTGLQTLGAVGITLLAALILRKQPKAIPSALAAAVLALVIAAPWYMKNIAWMHNPVYPFFYEKIGGKDWDERRAFVYQREQHSFGVGRREAEGFGRPTKPGLDLTQIGHATLGLAYQPGRYINPFQTQGGGNPLGAVGITILSALAAWLLSGKARAFEKTILVSVILSLGMWFVLSQQSRYIVALAVPLAILAGGAVSRLKVGPLIAVVTAAQALYSAWLLKAMLVDSQLMYVTGQVTQDQYLGGVQLSDGSASPARLPFYEGAKQINAEKAGIAKVALYDEVFGYLLDVPYFWANPGHSTIIPYDSFKNGAEYADWMVKNGFSHVWLGASPAVRSPEDTRKIMASMGLAAPDAPTYSPQELEAMSANWEQKYIPLLIDAVRQRKLLPAAGTRYGFAFRFVDAPVPQAAEE